MYTNVEIESMNVKINLSLNKNNPKYISTNIMDVIKIKDDFINKCQDNELKISINYKNISYYIKYNLLGYFIGGICDFGPYNNKIELIKKYIIVSPNNYLITNNTISYKTRDLIPSSINEFVFDKNKTMVYIVDKFVQTEIEGIIDEIVQLCDKSINYQPYTTQILYNKNCLNIIESTYNNYYIIELIINKRDVIHDGYCSDPGEDIGEWKYNIKEIYKIAYNDYKEIFNHISDDGTINNMYLQNKFNSDSLGCKLGSNYCGYDGSVNIVSGKIYIKIAGG